MTKQIKLSPQSSITRFENALVRLEHLFNIVKLRHQELVAQNIDIVPEQYIPEFYQLIRNTKEGKRFYVDTLIAMITYVLDGAETYPPTIKIPTECWDHKGCPGPGTRFNTMYGTVVIDGKLAKPSILTWYYLDKIDGEWYLTIYSMKPYSNEKED